ncbi:MAG: DUF177 domain-containing protein [Bacteroidetes bacterium]|nr:DUF177 domain-containing protein [Bacteroidota bacterium]HET6244427.1 DUF177 domain-containing protein [Bacteroidia bacterium]
MFDLNQLSIPFVGLKDGEYQYKYAINESFFEELEYSEIKKGIFNIDLFLLKQSNMLTLNFEIEGKAIVECDRCLDELEISVQTKRRLFVSFGEATHEETDEVFVLSYNEQELNVSQFIYEYIVLAIPLINSHPEGECNPEIVKKLEELKPKINNSDPRWDILNKLK